MFLVTTAANAAFVPAQPRIHEPPNDIYVECGVVRVVPPDYDRNPGYKVDVHVVYNEQGRLAEISAIHTRANGQTADRSEQYGHPIMLSQSGYRAMWSGFRHGLKMTGIFDSYNMTYNEFITRNGRLETSIFTRCHVAEGDL
jgi:hypothetical protein